MDDIDVMTMAALLRETEGRHGRYEPVAPAHQWSDWYASYIVARQGGLAADEAAARAGRYTEAVRA